MEGEIEEAMGIVRDRIRQILRRMEEKRNGELKRIKG